MSAKTPTTIPINEITEHDQRNARAWPAAVSEQHFGWLFRYNSGVTRRANSVLPLRADGNLSLDVRLLSATHFYRRHNAPCCFTITPASAPSGLDEALEDRGYTIDGTSFVQTTDTAAVSRIKGSSAEIVLSHSDSDLWRAAYMAGENKEKRNKYVEIMRRIPVARQFAVALVDNKPVAAGLGVLQDGWLTILGMQTAPDHRRSGHAATVLSGLAGWAMKAGSKSTILQVEADNEPARGLYDQAGFKTIYGYHYRVAAG